MNYSPTKVCNIILSHKDMFIILHNTPKFNTSRAKNENDAQNKFRRFYSMLISSIILSDLECSCGSHSWSYYGCYERYYTFLGFKIRVRITRIICKECGKTHALLFDDIIPFSTLSYDQILENTDDDYTTDQFHHKWLINKYRIFYEYEDMCLLNRRNCHLLFIST